MIAAISVPIIMQVELPDTTIPLLLLYMGDLLKLF